MSEALHTHRLAGQAIRGELATLAIENMHCGGCLSKIEKTLAGLPGVSEARANLSARRVSVRFDPERTGAAAFIEALGGAGYRAADLSALGEDTAAARDADFVRRIGVAGFAAANIMLLSVAVWAGVASDMGPAVESVLHWLSALIALPAVAYAGQPFFRSAVAAVKAMRLNMDVPISLAICLATLMSLFQTARGSEQVYFDAAVTLLFFLLIGRFLDSRVRTRAAGAAANLTGLKSGLATVIGHDGTMSRLPARALLPGMRVLVAQGERVPADGVLCKSGAFIDESLITGEPLPRQVQQGQPVYAGTINMGASVEVEATATDQGTLIAEIGRLMTAAEQGRGRYVRLADRAARFYSPAVHILGLSTFLGWMAAGAGWEQALTSAIAVLIITCPCALALAVPAVQVAATSRLMRKGIIVKAPDGLERLADVGTVVLDKTGTLTLGRPELIDAHLCDPDRLRRAASLAASSRHPYAKAIVAAAEMLVGPIPVTGDVREVPGSGLVRNGTDGEWRLGSADWCGLSVQEDHGECVWLTGPGIPPALFRFHDRLRSDAPEVVRKLHEAGFSVELLSGDRSAGVAPIAEQAGIDAWRAEARPDQKLARLSELKAAGKSVLMVGDGLNDAPALAAGHASLSPASAADISQMAADALFQGEALAPLVETLAVAQQTRRMALQNFAIALLYNAVSVPLAVAGFVTPLIAALAMSTSSILVTLNALRLGTMRCQLKRNGRP